MNDINSYDSHGILSDDESEEQDEYDNEDDSRNEKSEPGYSGLTREISFHKLREREHQLEEK